MRPLAKLLAALATGAAARPLRTLGTAIVLAAIGLALAATRLELHTSNLDLVDPDLPPVHAFLEFAERFGTPNVLVVGLEGADAAELERAVDTLVPRLCGLPGVRTAAGGPPTGGLPSGILGSDRYFHSHDGRLYFVFVQPDDPRSSAATLGPFVAGVRGVIEQAGLGERGVAARFTGMPQYALDDRDAVTADVSRLSVVALILVALLFMAGFVSVWRPLAAVATLLVATGWTLGLVALFPGYLTLLSAFFGSILFGLGIDYGIHVVARVEELAASRALDVAARAVAGVAPALVTGALTTALLFLSLTLCGFRGFAQLGLVAGVGVLLSLVATATVLPALLALAPVAKVRPHRTRELGDRLSVCARPGVAIAVGAAIVALAAIGVARGGPRFDADYLDLQPVGSDTVRLEREMVRRSDLSPQFAAFTVRDEEELRDLLVALLDREVVASVHSLADLGLFSPLGDQSRRLAPDEVAHLRADDGSLAVYAYPAGDIWDPQVGAEFRRALAGTGRDYTGMAALGDFMVQRSRRALRLAAALALVLLPLVVLLDFRDPVVAALALVPTALTAVTVPGLMQILDLSFNPLNVMALPIVLGISVDDGVHLTHRFLAERGDVAATLRGTGRAVLLTSATTLAAFGVLVPAHHRGLSSFALILVLGVATSLVLSLTLLPAVLSASRGRLVVRRPPPPNPE